MIPNRIKVGYLLIPKNKMGNGRNSNLIFIIFFLEHIKVDLVVKEKFAFNLLFFPTPNSF
jgi:hypothetical protein